MMNKTTKRTMITAGIALTGTLIISPYVIPSKYNTINPIVETNSHEYNAQITITPDKERERSIINIEIDAKTKNNSNDDLVLYIENNNHYWRAQNSQKIIIKAKDLTNKHELDNKPDYKNQIIMDNPDNKSVFILRTETSDFYRKYNPLRLLPNT